MEHVQGKSVRGKLVGLFERDTQIDIPDWISSIGICALLILSGLILGGVLDTNRMAKLAIASSNRRIAEDTVYADIAAMERAQRGVLLIDDQYSHDEYIASRGLLERDLPVLAAYNGDPSEVKLVSEVETLIKQKIAEMDWTIALLHGPGGFEAAREKVRTGEGELLMQRIKSDIFVLQAKTRVKRSRAILGL